MNCQTYVISLSFSDYLKDKSGMPKVIMAHQKVLNQHGVSYVYLYSVKKTVWRDDLMLFCEFGLIIDGKHIGIFSISDIFRFITQWGLSGFSLREIHIHHLLYVRLAEAQRLLFACDNVPIKIFLHDYYFCCTSYNLLKNGTFCGSRYLGDKSCLDCEHFHYSKRIEDKIDALIDSVAERVTFVAPSTDTLNRFIGFHPQYRDRIIVLPHQTATGIYQGNINVFDEDGKIRVAFLGMPTKNKGWDVWLELVKRYSAYGHYKFFVLNSSDDQYSGCTKVQVSFSINRPNAMVDALREHHIGVAVLWQLWPETYSYTCMEAHSANSFIVTNGGTGNVADYVSSKSCGIVLSNQSELFGLFDDHSKLQKLIEQCKKKGDCPQELADNEAIFDLLSDGDFFDATSISRLLTRTPIAEKIVLLMLRQLQRRKGI